MLEEFYYGSHPWSDETDIWEIDWNKDWQSFDPIIERIYAYFEFREKFHQYRDYQLTKKAQDVNKHITI